jgi:hypothetical protein
VQSGGQARSSFRAVPASRDHIEDFLSQKARQEDIEEWFAGGGGRTMASILRTLPESQMETIRACLNWEGRCVALWGYYPDHDVPEWGQLWLVATEEASKWGSRIQRMWPTEIARIQEKFSILVAVSYASNILHHTWLHHLGFDYIQTVAVGHFPFLMFARRSP